MRFINPDEKSCTNCCHYDVETGNCRTNNALSVLTGGMFCAEFEEKEKK